MKTCPKCEKKFASRGFLNHEKHCGVPKLAAGLKSRSIFDIFTAIWNLLKSTMLYFSDSGGSFKEQAFFWMVKVPIAFIILGYTISALKWVSTLVLGIHALVSSWYHFWTFGSFADIGIGLFGGIVSSADLVRTGMYKASSNIFGVAYDVVPRSESMLCYLDDSLNALGDLVSMRPIGNSTCTQLASFQCTL